MNAVSLRPSLFAGLWADVLTLLAVLLVALACWVLAYQSPLGLTLAVGGDAATGRREDDRPYLWGVHESEPKPETLNWWEASPGFGYRWLKPEATLLLPGVGGGPWAVSLLASSGRADGTAASSTWRLGPHQLPLSVAATPRRYHLLLPADAVGDLRLTMQTPAYAPPGDPRTNLAFVLRQATVRSIGGWQLPPLPHLATLAGALALLYATGRMLTLARPLMAGIALLAALALALVLATQRATLGVFTPILALLALICALPAATLWALSRLSWPKPAQFSILNSQFSMLGPVLALVLLAFALRLGGMLHPHAIFSDHRLNANNLLRVSLGLVQFTTTLPAEAGGGQQPYPPALYLLLAPFQLLFPVTMDGRVLLVQSGVALLDSLVVGLIWLLLRRAGLGQAAALLGAALYLAPPPLLASFSAGEYANLGGQALALPALAWLALIVNAEAQRRRDAAIQGLQITQHSSTPLKPGSARGTLRVCSGQAQHAELTLRSTQYAVRSFVPIVLITVGLLSHFGVAMSLGLTLLGWLGLNGGLGLPGRDAARLRATGQVALVAALAGLLALLGYYLAPPFLAAIGERLTASNDGGMGNGLLAIGASFVQTLFLPGGFLPPLLSGLGLLGLVLLWWCKPANGETLALATLLAAWWIGVVLAQGLLLVADQGLRWVAFLYPALCMGGGVALGWCWQRGRWGRALALLVPLALFAQGLSFW
nr:hypothetical protein [Chloroflexaceae bacterium]